MELQLLTDKEDKEIKEDEGFKRDTVSISNCDLQILETKPFICISP